MKKGVRKLSQTAQIVTLTTVALEQPYMFYGSFFGNFRVRREFFLLLASAVHRVYGRVLGNFRVDLKNF